MAGGVIATVLGGLIGYLGVAALREGGTYVLIDVAPGTLVYHDGRKTESFALGELGPLEVVQEHGIRSRTYRYRGEPEILRATRRTRCETVVPFGEPRCCRATQGAARELRAESARAR